LSGYGKDPFQALHDLPLGAYGQFTDKFGVRWTFVAQRK